MAEGLDVRFHHVVERIDWGEDGATIHCSGGASFSCDAVVCTVSLGVLKVRPLRQEFVCCVPCSCVCLAALVQYAKGMVVSEQSTRQCIYCALHSAAGATPPDVQASTAHAQTGGHRQASYGRSRQALHQIPCCRAACDKQQHCGPGDCTRTECSQSSAAVEGMHGRELQALASSCIAISQSSHAS